MCRTRDVRQADKLQTKHVCVIFALLKIVGISRQRRIALTELITLAMAFGIQTS